MKITKDLGFIPADTTLDRYNPVFIDASDDIFEKHGFYDGYGRMSVEAAKNVSPEVLKMAPWSTGGRITFRSDSCFVAIRAKIEYMEKNSYSGFVFDLMTKKEGRWVPVGSFFWSQGENKEYMESRIMVGPGMKDLMIHFPLCSLVTEMAVILEEGSEIEKAEPYRYTKPVYFYGSSIVHGACSSKACSCYVALASFMADTEYVNLGFGGAAKAEDAMIDYLISKDMSVLVYDYDHNAPDAEYLAKTHYAGYRKFREARPDVPVIMASKPDYWMNPELNEVRRQIIIDSYKKGIASGDTKLSFIDGREFFPIDARPYCIADGCHPNDMGYFFMAKAFSNELKKYL